MSMGMGILLMFGMLLGFIGVVLDKMRVITINYLNDELKDDENNELSKGSNSNLKKELEYKVKLYSGLYGIVLYTGIVVVLVAVFTYIYHNFV